METTTQNIDGDEMFMISADIIECIKKFEDHIIYQHHKRCKFFNMPYYYTKFIAMRNKMNN